MKLADILVPRRALQLPELDPAVEQARSYLEGLEVTPPVDIWLHGPGLTEGPEPADDDEYDAFTDAGGVLITAADQAEHTMDLDERATAIVRAVREADAVPGPLSWRRWAWLARVGRWSYSFGFGLHFGSCTTWDRFGQQWHPGPVRLVWPAHRVRWTCDGEPRVTWHMGYLFGRPGWWWECVWRQVRHPRRRAAAGVGWHRPEYPWAFGVCAACVPCPSCGAHRDCEPGCPELV